ncbi:hypothetical protein GTP23_19100 [Pseudoduganella sp. FT93W]|uniref:Uncharacterized protein n=1 Tax=Duganella fentianensis TaxID=2692177 RepID=A0A845I1G9_9BURK|nr:hypothetical protein [Duganella fentianensis]MYN47153.1 hypothetical protein [Duganella fentianensis]
MVCVAPQKKSASLGEKAIAVEDEFCDFNYDDLSKPNPCQNNIPPNKKRILHLTLVILLAPSIASHATSLPKSVRESCVLDHTTSPNIHLHRFATEIFYEQENYADGYDASYYFFYRDKEIGYAQKAQTNALLYSGKVYRLVDAISTSSPLQIATEFSPALAAWSKITTAQQSYICVSFNFDGIGHSGTFQNFRGAFLLDLNASKSHLYYAEGDIRRTATTKRKTK